MSNIRQYAAQVVLYALFFIPLAYLTHAPIHKHLAQDMAVLKVAVRHAGKIVGECTTLSKEAYANLPANMKRPETCPRERSPLQLELILDGKILYADSVAASGLHSDGVSSMYRRFVIPAGAHHLELFMTEEEVQALNILQSPRKVEDREAAYQELREVRRQLLKGANFHNLAK